jgi:hypothetical protein
MLTARHCRDDLVNAVIQFNVPLSNAYGQIQHPSPQDQYALDFDSIQSSARPLMGNDWMYFGAYRDVTTQKTPFEAQQSRYELYAGQTFDNTTTFTDLEVTGFGKATNKTLNYAQKTHAGGFHLIRPSKDGHLIALYMTDTTGGDSGAAIVDKRDGKVVGIHANGGCSSFGGKNSGTLITQPELQSALQSPMGVCKG